MDGVILRPFQQCYSHIRTMTLVVMKGCVQSNPVYGWKDFRLQQGSNSNRPVHNSLSCRKVYENGKVGTLKNSLMCTHILQDYLKTKLSWLFH